MSSHSFDVDVVVVGAGVVGLAAARAVGATGRSVVVLERNAASGRETSSRNSEVIHAGIYYPPGSLKAQLCVRGNRLLYEFCKKMGIGCRRLGKLIIAVEKGEEAELHRLAQVAAQNGVSGLRPVGCREIQDLEPHVNAVAGLFSSDTGIVDSHGLTKALEAEVRRQEGQLVFHCAVRGIQAQGAGFAVDCVRPSGEVERIGCQWVINAAGLEADRLAQSAGIGAYRLWWCKGDYFAVGGRAAALVSHLVYPVPARDLCSLGVHVTLDLAGRMRLGPDATFLDERKAFFDVDPQKRDAFFLAAGRYLPHLKPTDLQPDSAGIRPKLQGPGQPWQDFVIKEETENGVPGLVDLVGIESPGLTSCLAIGEAVAALLS